MEIIKQHPTAYIEQLTEFDLNEKYKEAQAIRFLRVVAGCLAVTTVTLGIAIAAMMPLKSTIPYVQGINQATGKAETLTVMSEPLQVGFYENLDRSEMSEYIMNYEMYDAMNVTKYYNYVGLRSSSAVANAFIQRYKKDDPESLHVKYKDEIAVKVEIGTVEQGVILPGVEGGSGRVSYKKTAYYVKTGKTISVEYLVASLGFEYQNVLLMDDDVRLKNPWGFHVKFFDINPDGLGGNR